MDAQVALVGAGPAGALLAGLLASRGIDTLLIERQSDFEREFRGEFLMPSGIRALRQAGFDLSTVATKTPRIVQGYLNGRRFMDFRTNEATAPSSANAEPSPTAVSQPELLEALVKSAQESGHCEFRRGTRVRRIERNQDGTQTLSVRGEQGGEDEALRVSYVIGCDGRGSICRRTLAPKVQTRGTPLDVVWFKIPRPAAWTETTARIQLGRGHLMLVLPSADGLLQLAWVILKGTYGDLKSRDAAGWVEHMSPHTDPELADHLHTHREDLTRPFLLRAVTDRVHGWASPGTLLIGDAAHTMSPVGAQGINIALRDAIVAANQLIPALQKGGGIDEAASTVEALRGPEVDRIQHLAGLPPKIVLGRTPLHQGVRRLVAFAAPRALRRGAASGPPIDYFLNGVTDVTLRV